jgi:hypothetical protein
MVLYSLALMIQGILLERLSKLRHVGSAFGVSELSEAGLPVCSNAQIILHMLQAIALLS